MSHALAPHGPKPSDAQATDRRKRRLLILLLVLALLLLAIGIWFALSRSNPPYVNDGKTDLEGSHEGQATTGAQVRLVVNQTSVVTGLAPGAPAQQLWGTFTNRHSKPLHVGSVTAEVSATSRPGCPVDDFVINGSPAPVGAWVAPGADQGSWSGLTIRMRTRPLNQDGCKNTHVVTRYAVQ